jgi:hypothetical protein
MLPSEGSSSQVSSSRSINHLIRPALGYTLLIGDLKEPERWFIVGVRLCVAAVLIIDAHVVLGLIQESDQPIDFLSGLLTELPNRAEDVGRLCVGRDVQPIQAGYRGKCRRV